ncbi:MAG: threonine synthase [Dehalobacterium sp.]
MYISSRGNFRPVTASEAICLGMAPGGGLFVPEKVPNLDEKSIYEMAGQSYREIAQKILELYLDDFTTEEIKEIVDQSYNQDNFDHPDIAPVAKLDEQTFILELWHGPTAAFKDMALQIMPRLLVTAVRKKGSGQEVIIPVATSGDTGKAALEGFKNVPGVKIIVFYPHGGVSKVQELQMTTADGDNVAVVAVRGNFDDCQTAVKKLFTDQEFNRLLADHQMTFSSANSINWGRLLPQIVYYFWGYSQLMHKGEVAAGEKINVVVPTGNFGNILACYYAFLMGLPVDKMICASNKNKVLTDVIETGIYDRQRLFYKTISPSMDILISSNFERFLFEITDHDAEKISAWYQQLQDQGVFQVEDVYRLKWQDSLLGGFATDEETKKEIETTYTATGYVLDPHTGAGMAVYRDYVKKSGDQRKTIIDATANPYKFNRAVLEAISGQDLTHQEDEFAVLEELHKVTGMSIHSALRDLDKRPVRHQRVIEKDQLGATVKDILGLQ